MSRGIDRERELRRYLQRSGWLVIRAAGSLGPVDVVAIATAAAIYPKAMLEAMDALEPEQGEVLLIECKSTSGGPYERFGPADRQDLLDLANSVGAAAWLAYKPKSAGRWQWIPSWAWPADRRSPTAGLANLP